MTPAASGASSPLPFKAAQATDLPAPAEWIVAVLCCAALLAGLLWLLRRHRGPSLGRRPQVLLQVLDQKLVGHQTQLLVLRYQDRRLLLSVSPTGTQCLRDDAEPAEEHLP